MNCQPKNILITILLLFLATSANSAIKKSVEARPVEVTKVTEKPQKLSIEASHLDPVFKNSGDFKNGEPKQAEAQQAGEDIATAVAIASLPFIGTGTTVGYANDYDEVCPIASTSPDVVYSFVPTENLLVDISLCNSDYSTHLWVYENDETTVAACNRFDVLCGATLRSALADVQMNAGNTYYIVIDGEAGASGNYEIDISSEIAPPTFALHPALADDGVGGLVLAFETFSIDTGLFWQGSNNDGATFTGGVGWSFDSVPQFSEVKYWGSGTEFYGTFVAPYQVIDSAAPTYLVRITDPTDVNTYGLSYWDWSEYGWHDMKDVSIACDDGLDTWHWGMMSFVHSSHYTAPDVLIDAPHIMYQSTSAGQAQISWFNGVNGCNSTDAEIDRVTHKTYAAFDVYDTDSSQWAIFLRQDFSDDWAADANAWVYTVGSTMEHLQYPSVAAYNGDFLMLVEYWDENSGSDRDIYLFRSSDSDMVTMTDEIFEATTDSERFPDITHVENQTYIATFVRNGTHYYKVTEDAGASWTTAAVASAPFQTVVAENAYAHIADGGGKSIWEYQLAGDPSIYLMYGPLGVQDVDGDGIADDVDNCPNAFNPGQEDANNDDIGDACCCLGNRGNANGDPGDLINISDVTFIVAYLFGIPSGPLPACPAEGNANGDPSELTNIADITYLVNYLFGIPTGPIPGLCP